MGYHMAVNLRNKIGTDKTMIVVDVNEKACEKYLAETANAGPSRIAKNPYEAIQDAVSLFPDCKYVVISSETPRIR
jgi:hypothetical protein